MLTKLRLKIVPENQIGLSRLCGKVYRVVRASCESHRSISGLRDPVLTIISHCSSHLKKNLAIPIPDFSTLFCAKNSPVCKDRSVSELTRNRFMTPRRSISLVQSKVRSNTEWTRVVFQDLRLDIFSGCFSGLTLSDSMLDCLLARTVKWI